MKITDDMIDAGFEALKRRFESHEIKTGRPMPDFDSLPDEEIEEAKAVVRTVIQAAANAYFEAKT